MGSIFARPPARAEFGALSGTTIALDSRAEEPLGTADAEFPLTLCVGGERQGLPPEVLERACDRPI
jgi:tRNA G18 (ribose-2'-O)-methylase SpoU